MVIVLEYVEVVSNVLGYLRSRGGGKAEGAWDLDFGCEVGEFEVIGSEVVAPFGDAVGFVDSEEGNLGLSETLSKFLVGESFWGDVEEFEGLFFELLIKLACFFGIER